MDGVILDSEPAHFAAFQTTLQRRGKQLSEDDYKANFAGLTDEAGFRKYFASINETLDLPVVMAEKTAIYLELASNRIVAYPGVVALIQELSGKVPLALVTGSLRAEAHVALIALGIKDCFSVIICAEDVKEGKPNPEGYLQAQKALSVSKDECVIVEDSPSGVLAAKNAGIISIAVTTTHTRAELSEGTRIVDVLSITDFL